MEDAIAIHTTSEPDEETCQKIEEKLDLHINRCISIEHWPDDLEKLLGLHLFRDKILFVGTQEDGANIAALAHFLTQTMRGNLSIVSLEEEWDKKKLCFIQRIVKVYPG